MSINPFDNDDSSQQAGRAACLDYIEQNWPDIRPRSVRERLTEREAR